MKAYQIVLNHIESQIINGDLSVGSALPAERDLAVQFGVSRTAVRQALQTLSARGLITSAVGAGPASGTRIAGHHDRALSKLLQMHVALSQFEVDEVVEARVMLERRSAALAARSATENDLNQINDILADMETPGIKMAEYNKLDTAFHVTIAEVSGNRLIAALTSAIRQSLAEPIRIASEEMTDWDSFRVNLMAQHRAVYNAIRARDAALAAALLDEHIRTAYAILPFHPTSKERAA